MGRAIPIELSEQKVSHHVADQWYYKLLGEEFGPAPLETVVDLIQASQLSADDEVRRGESGAWVAAESIPELWSSMESAGPAELQDLSELDFTFDRSNQQADAAQPSATGVNSGTPAIPVRFEPDAVEAKSYFCQVLGQEFGPMDEAELATMIGDGSVSRSDPVKVGAAGTWTDAGKLPGLVKYFRTAPTIAADDPGFTGVRRGATAASAVTAPAAGSPPNEVSAESVQSSDDVIEQDVIEQDVASADATTEVDQTQIDEWLDEKAEASTAEVTDAPSPVAVDSSETTDATSEVVAPQTPLVTATAPVSSPSPAFASAAKSKPMVKSSGYGFFERIGEYVEFDISADQLKSPKFLGVIAALIVVLVIKFVPFSFGPAAQEYYDRVVAIQKEYEQLRDGGVGGTKMQEFRERASRDTAVLIEELVKTAHSRDDDGRARQQLLWAARDHLLKMLDGGSNESGESAADGPTDEEQFNTYLQGARRFMSGEAAAERARQRNQPLERPVNVGEMAVEEAAAAEGEQAAPKDPKVKPKPDKTE